MNKWIFLFFLFSNTSVFGQPDDQKAFAKLKTLAGVWQLQSSEDRIFDVWSRDGKQSLTQETYQIQDKDTVLLARARLNYTKFLRFAHTSALHYNQNSLESDVVYPFRLEKEQQYTCTFRNFNQEFPNTIVFYFPDKNTLFITHSSKDHQHQVVYHYKRINP